MKRILIIDDEVKVRQVYRDALEAEGYAVFDSESSEGATEAFLRWPPDLVLLDIKMPKLDGRFMAEVIELFGTNARVIVASVFPLSTQAKMLPQADDYFDKSQGPDVLIEKVNRIFRDS